MEIDGRPTDAEAALAAIGHHGLGAWRQARAGAIRSAPLLDLPLVRELCAKAPSGADGQSAAIEQAIQQAMGLLPKHLELAARAHFGLDLPPGSTKEARGEQAAKALKKTSARWYFDTGKYFPGMAPADYVVALLVCAMCQSTDPVADFSRYLAGGVLPDPPASVAQVEHPPLADEPAGRRSRWGAYPRTIAAAIILLTLALAGTAAILFSTGDSSKGNSPPGPPPIINAATGKPVSALIPPPKRGLHPDLEDEGNTFRLTGKVCFRLSESCAFHSMESGSSFDSPDDQGTFIFQVALESSFPRPIKELHLSGSIVSLHTYASVILNGEWLTPDGFPTPSVPLQQPITLPGTVQTRRLNLTYVPRSTKLYEPSNGAWLERRLLTILPDTLFTPTGLTLTNVGGRSAGSGSAECSQYHCPAPYIATIISFAVRLNSQ